MGLFRRLSLLLQGRANKALGELEDPADALELAFSKQLESLQQVRRSLADVVTSQKQMEIQLRQIQGNKEKLEQLARKSLTQDREDLAAAALTQSNILDGQTKGLEEQMGQLSDQRKSLESVEQRLQARVTSMRLSKESLKAQYGAARASVKAGEAVLGLGKEYEEIGLLLDRSREKILQTSARAQALGELIQTTSLNPATSSPEQIASELEADSLPSKVQHQLADLRRDLGLPSQTQGD